MSGKRQAIKGKHVMMTPDILGSVAEAVKVTRVQKRRVVSRKRGAGGKKEVIEESSEESEGAEEELDAMFDCISSRNVIAN